MKSVLIFFLLLLCCQTLYAADLVQKTEKGLYRIELSASGKVLKNGVNSVDISVHDTTGKAVDGARVTVVPWSIEMGHGVWEKPQTTEQGGGKYHVENVTITREGKWELRVNVRKGVQEDRGIFSISATRAEQVIRKKAEKPKGNYSRTLHNYTLPNVTLLNQDGKKVNIRTLVDFGKPVVMNFIYTTCNTICPVLSASFTTLRKNLGPDVDNVQFISISIDPEHDRPEQMKKYLSRFTSGKGWEFLTGSKDDIRRVLKALEADVEDKMSHEPLYLLRASNSDEWVRIKGLTWSSDLMIELRNIENK